MTPTTSSSTQVDMAVLGDLVRHGSAPALVTPDGIMTYAELSAVVDEAADRMTGERQLVLVAGRATVASVATYLAATTHGHTALMVPSRDDAVESMIRAFDPDVVLRPDAEWPVPRREGSAHLLHPDLALLLSTSGSTGSPKLVRLSGRAVEANAVSIANYLQLAADDRGLTTLPLHYSYGLSVLNSHVAVGAATVLVEGSSVIDECFWREARAGGATSLPGVPHTFRLLDTHGFTGSELPTLRRMTQAGGRMPPEQVARYAAMGREHGWDLFVMYGQTEATARMAYLPPELAESRPHALGRPIPGGELRLEPVPEISEPGVGELVYRGDNVMMGYATSPADLATGPQLTELRTGDLAMQDDDGLFTWVGRRARFAKIFGLRIDLDAVERHLHDDGIVGACFDDDQHLLLVVEQHADSLSVARRVAAHLCVPTHAIRVRTVAALPRTAAGKPDRAAMLELARSVTQGPDSTAPVSQDVRTIVAQVLDVHPVGDQDTFVGLGGDSLSYVETSVRLEEAGIALRPDWHRLPMAELESASQETRPRSARLDLSILMRAVAIVLIVGSHGNLWAVAGGAHLLLGVAGYNFARFRLAEPSRRRRTRHGLRSLRRIAVASATWIGGVALVAGTYEPATALLLNGVVGSDTWTVQWQFWFIEAIVWTQLTVLLALAVPALHRRERAAPFAFACSAVVVALVARHALVGVEAGPTERYSTIVVAWCFALGWAAGVAKTRRHRILVTLLVLLAVPGFFGDPVRDAIVIAGVLALVWVRRVVVPRRLAGVVAVLAGASLHIYLTHWQVYPHFEDWSPVLALTLSLVVGIAYWRVWTRVTAWRPVDGRRRLTCPAEVSLGDRPRRTEDAQPDRLTRADPAGSAQADALT